MLIVSKSRLQKFVGDPNGKNLLNIASRSFCVMCPFGNSVLNDVDHSRTLLEGKWEKRRTSSSASVEMVLVAAPMGGTPGRAKFFQTKPCNVVVSFGSGGVCIKNLKDLET